VRWGWVRSNVADMARPPRIAQKRVRAPSIDVVRKVIDEAERRDPHKAALLMLAALSGMRRGELCALRWSDLDLEAGTMEVARSVVVIPGGLAEKAPKTDRSRSVALDAVAVALLKHHHARTSPRSPKLGDSWPPTPSCSRPSRTAPLLSGRTT
jgi:integrase